ncbi:MAG: lipopolysaccharide biosynthesis protein [Actinomycetota bacterium]|nr:lipopolysaccharide biosynthesis protein [Actinomycetota bacterium]
MKHDDPNGDAPGVPNGGSASGSENGGPDEMNSPDTGKVLESEAVGDESVGQASALAPEAAGSKALTHQAASDVATVAKGGAVQIAGQISQRGLGQIFTAVATRIIGTSGLGLYSQAVRVLAIASQLGLAGFNYAAMRFIARARAGGDPSGVRGAARVSLVATAVVSAVVVVALLLLADPFGEAFADPGDDPDELADLLRLGAAYIPLFAFMQVLRYCTQAYKTMVPSVMAGNIIQPIARFLFAMAAFAVGLEVAGAVSSLVVSMGVGAVAAAYYYQRMLTPAEKAATPRVDKAAMIRFALPQGGASMLGVQTLGIGVIVLGLYRSDFLVGVFTVALALQGPGTVFLGGIVNIWAPMVSDLYDRGEIARLDSLYKTITRWVATFSFPVFAVIILEPDVFARILDPNSADRIAPVAAILAVGNLFYTGTGPTGYVISMSGRPGINLINSIVAVGLYVGLGVLVAEEHGVIGVAFVDAGVTIVVNTIRVIQAKVFVGVQPFGKSFLKPVLATLVGAAALLAWRLVPGESLALEISGIAVAAIVYLVVLKLLGMDPEERHVWDMISKKMPGKKRRKKKERGEV